MPGQSVQPDDPEDFVKLDGGTFQMGSTEFYPEEGPVIEATVGPFELARYPVTNRQFAAFVDATGYTTTAERRLDPTDFPDAEVDVAAMEPGSLVFIPTSGPVNLRDWRQWWHWVDGANWRHPHGPDSDLDGKDEHPVVQVSFEDASAYTEWAGLRLPTEAEWEFAARGGLAGATYAWGEEPNDGSRANTWQGRFPYDNSGARGHVGTAPVGSFPANQYGLHEITGNVWEWTSDTWTADHRATAAAMEAASQRTCACSPDPVRPSTPGAPSGQLVLKGGSHLCAPEYCLRYRPAARSPQTPDSATTHLGFRCAR